MRVVVGVAVALLERERRETEHSAVKHKKILIIAADAPCAA